MELFHAKATGFRTGSGYRRRGVFLLTDQGFQQLFLVEYLGYLGGSGLGFCRRRDYGLRDGLFHRYGDLIDHRSGFGGQSGRGLFGLYAGFGFSERFFFLGQRQLQLPGFPDLLPFRHALDVQPVSREPGGQAGILAFLTYR